jgi:ubiquinone/menaquinone biosynthesis C-methylase UbiE
MLANLFDAFCSVSPRIRRFLIRNWFQYLSTLDKDALMIFMNLGYADTAPEGKPLPLQDSDSINRYCIEMYHHVAGAIDLDGRDVLEVGSGRGGGASYIMRALHPRSMTGVDISHNAVAFCNRYHHVQGLRFVQGDAEDLPFADESFDAIVNIESSYGYGNMDAFLRQVSRALRPNGYFLFTDYRDRGESIALLRQQLHASGLTIQIEENINANVLKALDLDNERKLKLIDQKVPGILRQVFIYFAAMKGSRMYRALKSGEVEYLRVVLFKPAKEQSPE